MTPEHDALVKFLRGHHIYCTAQDGRFEQAAQAIAALSAEVARLTVNLDDTVSTLAAVRATAQSDDWADSAEHIYALCGETLARAALRSEPMSDAKVEITEAQRTAALEGRVRECYVDHPIGTRCPLCARWPFSKGGAADFVARIRAEATLPPQPDVALAGEALAYRAEQIVRAGRLGCDAMDFSNLGQALAEYRAALRGTGRAEAPRNKLGEWVARNMKEPKP